ncbi:MAG: transketolase family protein [Candidatus Omnitrophica bacterium]|nr:transketolase family protein [Candidatus Omnitrophota bacterium]
MSEVEFLYARDIYGKTLVELGKKDLNVVVLDADLSASTRTSMFGKVFPGRFFNFGVAEQNMMAAAAGLASCGKIVFVSTFAMFATARALDQLRNTVCYNEFNVKIVATHGGITVGEDGSSHQALEDIAFLRSIPNIRIIVPSDAPETKDAVLSAYQTSGPFYIRLGRAKVPTIPFKKKFILGKGYILGEDSLDKEKDVAIIACGVMVYESLQAAKILKEKGITVTVANFHTITPIDEELIVNLAKRHRALLVCEEHQSKGGLYSAVCETLAKFYPKRAESIGIDNRFGQSGSPKELMQEYELSSEFIATKAEKLLQG